MPLKLDLKALLPPSQNPLVPDTFGQRLREARCRKVDHVRNGSITGLPQATCRRCGRKLSGALPQVSEWKIPE